MIHRGENYRERRRHWRRHQKSESEVVNANATAILRASSAASGVGGVAGVEALLPQPLPAVAAEPGVTITAIKNVANAQANRSVRYLEKKP